MGKSLEVLLGSMAGVRFELSLIGNPITRGRKHVAYVDVKTSILVVVAPTNGHAGGNVLDSCRRSYVREFAAVVFVKTVAAVIVGDIKVGITVVVIVFPCRRDRRTRESDSVS